MSVNKLINCVLILGLCSFPNLVFGKEVLKIYFEDSVVELNDNSKKKIIDLLDGSKFYQLEANKISSKKGSVTSYKCAFLRALEIRKIMLSHGIPLKNIKILVTASRDKENDIVVVNAS